ncbi:MAG: PAS domain S-box protein [Syntrophobacterales bacterium]|nr:PAS domain S-box protein [Syntrophobacterales bacterium]HNQ00958.1 PAS domain S-box protein [Syntrophales bacterium]
MKTDERRTKAELLQELDALRGEVRRLRAEHAGSPEAELRDRTLAESNPLGIFFLQRGAFTYVNARFEQSTGYRAEELLGKDSLSIVHPEDRERVRREALEMLQKKRQAPYEFRAIRKDGSVRWILGTVAPAMLAGERAVYGSYMDVTEQRETLRRLQELETLEASILDALPVAVIVLRERKILFANRAVEAVFGWKPEELQGRGTRILYRSEEEYEEIGRHFYPVLERQRTHSEEYPCRHRDGHDILCFVSTSRIGTDLQEKGIVATYEDITLRKRAEEALKGSEERLRAILQGSPTPTFVIDRGHRVIGWNRALEVLTGVRSGEVVDTENHSVALYGEKRPTVADLLVDGAVDPSAEIRKWYGTRYRRSALLEEAFEATGPFTFPGREPRWLHFTSAAVRDGGGTLVGAVETMTDVSALKRAEEELQLTVERLRKATAGIIRAIDRIVETRDPYTAGHQHEVARLASALAQEMALPADTVEAIYVAASIHDLGKIYVPAEILSKPGHISDIERGIIRTHPQVGYDILKSIDFPWPIAEIVLQHHERLDGSGYPRGLRDGDIRIEARILGLSDVVESMGSHRPYRPTLGMERALAEIRKNRGTLYDPEVVDACLRLFEEGRFAFEEPPGDPDR